MENVVFTQLTVAEIRTMLREEVRQAMKESLHMQEQSNEKEDDFMTIQEAAKFLSLAVPSVYGLVYQRKIPHIKRGKRLIFEKKQIIEWLRSARQNTKDTTATMVDNYLVGKKAKF